jgi:hypothetical protein
MSRPALRLDVAALSVLGPGLPGWEVSRAILANRRPYCAGPVELPAPPELSPAERRRAIPSVRLALAVGAAAVAQSGEPPAQLPVVFASSGADGETIAAILSALTEPAREVSPTRFHNSVHNAPSGYWSLAMRSQEAATSVSCHDSSFAAGLLEAGVQAVSRDGPILLVAYDLPYPEPLHTARPIEGSFGVALVLAPMSRDLPRIELALEATVAPETTLAANPALERLRRGNPAARALPLLALLAQQRAGSVRLAFGQGALAVTVAPP